MKIKPATSERRTPEQLAEHYQIERELASRLRASSRQERRHLYSSLYDELYRRLPSHPQLTRKASPTEKARAVHAQMRLLRRFLGKDTTFLEIGPGDCALSFAVAGLVKRVYAVDVSDEITHASAAPENFQLILSDGCGVPVPPGSVDLAYSNQLMEHLHPDDAAEQLRNIYDALAPGGAYVCITPNRLTGPHDISRYFDRVATGFHLKEYAVQELHALFRQAGFARFKAYSGGKGIYARLPLRALIACEHLLLALPAAAGRAAAHSLPVRALLNCQLVGIKPAPPAPAR